MAKSKTAVALVAIALMASQVATVEGTLVSRSVAGIVVRNKKPRSSKFQDTFIPAGDLIAIYSNEDGDVSVVYRQALSEYTTVNGTGGDINDAGFIEVVEGDMTVEINPAYAGVANADAEAEAEAPAAKKAPAKKATAKAEEEEEEAPAPKKGKAAAKVDEEETGDDEYSPEVGDHVKVSFEDEDEETVEVAGEVTKVTAKSVTVKDEDGDEEVYKLADVTIEKAKAKKKPAAKKAAAEDDEEEAKPAKGKAKAKPAEDEEEDEKPAKKAGGKAKAAASDDDGEW